MNQTVVTTQVVQTHSIGWPLIAVTLTILGITLGGFEAIVRASQTLGRTEGLGRDPAMMMMFMGLLIILVSDFMLISFLSRLLKNTVQTVQPAQPAQLPGVEAGRKQIPARPQPYVSTVTEHTTRTLEPSLREK